MPQSIGQRASAQARPIRGISFDSPCRRRSGRTQVDPPHRTTPEISGAIGAVTTQGWPSSRP